MRVGRPSMMRLRAAAGRLRREDGHTLIELLVVMSILAVVLTPLASSFATGMKQEVDQMRREQAYANARLAMQRMRADIHCSGGVTSVDQNDFGGFTLTLTENHETQDGWCAGVIPAGDTATGVQWCTVPDGGSPTRFTLFRFLGDGVAACGGSTMSTFQVAYIAMPPAGWPTNLTTVGGASNWIGNLWPDPAACSSARLPTVAVDLNIAVEAVLFPKENYELRDEMALRNANRC